MWSVQTPGGFSAQNGQLVGNVGTPGVIVWSDSFGPSLEAYLTVAAFDPSDSEIELILKNQGLLQECDSILVDFQPNGGGDAGMSILGIYACLPNSPMTILQEDFTLSEGDVFGARVCSDGTLLVYKNGVIVTTQDTSPFFADATSEGKVGLFAGGLVSPARFQRFGGGTVP
jgi:hypothetical protein